MEMNPLPEHLVEAGKKMAEDFKRFATVDAETNNIILDSGLQKQIVGKVHIEQKIKSYYDKSELAIGIWKANPYFYDKSRMWWLWDLNLKKWNVVDDKDILNMVSDNSDENTVNSKEKNEILESMSQYGRRKVPKVISPTWIQFQDKIIDIRTGEKFFATPEYFVTNPIPWSLKEDGDNDTPTMDRIFEEWVGKDYVKTLYQILAYSLLPDYPIHRIFCFIGGGMNGKSKFLELLTRFIGQTNCCCTELDTLLNSRFEVTRLHKKLICQMGETDFNEMSKTSILKKLSGGDMIGFEYKRKDPFEEKSYAKILIATNNLPTTTDKTVGFYRRWMIIDFPNQFSEAKDILADIPEEEYNNLATKCSSILKELIENRTFHNEGTIEERTDKYESKSNFLEKFLKLFTTQKEDDYITKSDFGKKFASWCDENKHRKMSDNSIASSMKKLEIRSERRYFAWMYDGKGGQARVWEGIIWKD